ncbi:hypothetical protein [Flavobacterium sp. KACC 22763]|uniref:hypothetical protein n=1 Tax=Flavobacterium sp. KACC 22763 TaxID=3025668 RepID=UPI002366B9CC|nr:hypothetical protein [Flavobacterium sp. KACC 22763]WDF63062.1 hypothetical protein PQ463_15745 [Flavobacterium sp. KACC 22763]
MNKTLILVFFLMNSAFSQKRDVIYRISYDSYTAGGYFYGISVLYLRDDHSYRLSDQKYNARKMARKNVLRSSVDEYGKWKMSGDTLLLYDNRQQMKFIKVNNKKIAFLIDDVERADYCWKKVKY